MKHKITIIFILLCHSIVRIGHAQSHYHIDIDAATIIDTMSPIWRDHYENNLLLGYGGNPSLLGPHKSFFTDVNFIPEMNNLKPRFIRISIGRADNPPDTNYYSGNSTVLKNLPYEFYHGDINLSDADDLSNYNFSYIDSLISLVQIIGAEPFITMDYMPFQLSSDTIPNYQAAMALDYNLAYDNSIRNAPPKNNEVYGRVMYHFIKHCYDKFGVIYFEHWNEPDQQWLNPIMVKFFWTGDEYDLYNSYAAIADEVSNDPDLSSHVKIGGCSFAFYSLGNLIPIRFLQEVQAYGTRLDFLSFHPYSDIQYEGGYDSAKVSLATNWRNTYVPEAELINAEWGRIDQNTNVWGDLDYGLHKVEHIIDMLNRNVSMSFEVSMFDQETSTDNYSFLGMYRVGPVAPKPTAYVFYNMNQLNETLNRLSLSTNGGISALAGMNNTSDKIVIVTPAPIPNSMNDTICLHISNLPWGSDPFLVNRYELTDQSYQDGIIKNLTMSYTVMGPSLNDTVIYPSVNNSGRLIVWEILRTPTLDNIQLIDLHEVNIFPNPTTQEISLQFGESIQNDFTISIFDAMGSLVYSEKIRNRSYNYKIRPNLPNTGIYFVVIEMNGKQIFTRNILSIIE